MLAAAEVLEFERAAHLRDQIAELKGNPSPSSISSMKVRNIKKKKRKFRPSSNH